MAAAYASMICSRVAKAETSIMSVERGTWKLVTIASTTWNVEPGMRYRLVVAFSRTTTSPLPRMAAESGTGCRVKRIGLEDCFTTVVGDRQYLREIYGMDGKAIAEKAEAFLKE